MLVVDDPGRYDVGIPLGTTALALELAVRAAELASSLTGVAHHLSKSSVVRDLRLPLVVGDDVEPDLPRGAPGGGFVHVDVLPDDEDLLTVLATELPPPDAEELARRAQECRLPVTPYRASVMRGAAMATLPRPTRIVRPSEVTVVDMTAMWAGPLCTRLLADWGARVVTVEPDARRDGLRGSPAQFAALDRGKQRVPWDLRRAADRAAFDAAVAGADVLVESFSARVLPNLGYDVDALHHLNPALRIVALRAFPSSSPEAGWVAYGRGVHAASGLGMVTGEPVPARFAYPDPLAGLAAYGTVLAALGGAGGTVDEVSLAGAIAPLVSADRGPRPPGRRGGAR